MRCWTGHLLDRYDVVVVGSGAGGLTAALAARHGGASVAVLEKAAYLGGTAAVSGGMLWVPMNQQMRELGREDTRDAAMRYLEAVAGGQTDRALLGTIIDRGVEMLAFVDSTTQLSFVAMDEFPDYHAEWDGSHPGGRSLEPELYDITALGELAEALRPDARPPFTMREYETWRIFTRFPWDELDRRADKGLVARGRALIGPLVEACASSGVSLVTEAPVERLTLLDSGVVTGVRVGDGEVVAERGVVLACGGYEWNQDMVRQFLPGPVDGSCSPPHNTGDGIRMATKAGAKLGNMSQAWWGPMVQLPDEHTDGAPTSTLLRFERTGPRSLMVNRDGRRFVNEAHNYNDMTKTFHAFDPGAYRPANPPIHLIFDQGHLEEYGFLSHRAGSPTPDWLIEAQTIHELAGAIGVDPAELEKTVARFNAFAARGKDPDFHRGESAYDRYWGDQLAEHPCLGPVDRPPYYAIEVFSGVIGTKGGISTDHDGRALDAFGDPIPGLFAVGNTTAHPMGIGYPGAGATLGPAMTMGYVAGTRLARS
jgi:3-oxosteroid 1-dehydrogenase